MISDKKRLEVANVCYANVSSMFAMFCNDAYRGPNFKWANFCDMMVREADLWMMIHNVRGNKDEIHDLARQYAHEIAERMIKQSGFVGE